MQPAQTNSKPSFQYHFVLRSALTVAWGIVSWVAQKAFDRPDASLVIKLGAPLVVIIPFALLIAWTRKWYRNADEYQLFLTHKAISTGAVGAIVAGVMAHWLAPVFLPVMTMPAFATFLALVYYRQFVRAR